jgi:hypothetical protein
MTQMGFSSTNGRNSSLRAITDISGENTCIAIGNIILFSSPHVGSPALQPQVRFPRMTLY